ncbi:MAG TPA: hypothetical protein PK449_06180 [Exilispira sp.]|nr:hypothetical protein [Exilispira sp.]
MYRISTIMHSQNMQKDMMRLEGKIFNTNNKISSGIAFTRPSEDPENFL